MLLGPAGPAGTGTQALGQLFDTTSPHQVATIAATMNSYFEQSGFYGSHHHQAAAGAGAHHHDQTAAAYRFPLGLGMSPYASSQHHHHHMARPPQDSPYDASVAAACKLYSSASDSAAQQGSVNYSSSNKADCVKSGLAEQQHQNG